MPLSFRYNVLTCATPDPQASQKKRRNFYKTEEGQAKKRYYAEKASKKPELIRLLKEYKTLNKNEAELTKETIERLIKNFL